MFAASLIGTVPARDVEFGASVYKRADRLRPRPTVVPPGEAGDANRPGRPPGDAVMLFDGRDLSAWMEFNPRGEDDPSKGPQWIVKDGYTQAFGNQIQTRETFADCHLHLEWMTSPEEAAVPERIDQRRGNSGLEFAGHPEIQILDSYRNDTYPDGQAAALYGVLPPLVNASRPPGEWQSYDVFYTAPRHADGKLVKPATFTILHNGLPVHVGVELKADVGATRIRLRPHGSPVRFRNIWVRPLHRYDENHGQPLPVNARTANPFKPH